MCDSYYYHMYSEEDSVKKTSLRMIVIMVCAVCILMLSHVMGYAYLLITKHNDAELFTWITCVYGIMVLALIIMVACILLLVCSLCALACGDCYRSIKERYCTQDDEVICSEMSV